MPATEDFDLATLQDVRVRVLRVFFDYGHEWPLWEVGDKTTMEPSDYGFSPELANLMCRWREAWYLTARLDVGQPAPAPSAEEREHERDLARQVIAMVRREAPADVSVEAAER